MRVNWRCSALLQAVIICCVCCPTSAKTGKHPITGTFLQIDTTTMAWPASKWRRELEAMKRLGMDTLIIQTTAGENGAFYPSDTLDLAEPRGCPDLVGTLVQIGDQLGIRVFLGLHGYNVWKPGGSCREMIERDSAVADELAELYGKHRNFAGWYLNQEFSDWLEPSKSELAQAYRRLAKHCHTLVPGKPVAIAPYSTTRSLDEDACRRGWLRMLPLLGVDIVMLQDGIGCNRGLTAENVPPVYRAVSEACHMHNVRFWSDLEIFDIRDWSPAPIDRISAQIKSESPYVEKIVIWEFNHYMSPLRGDRAKKLYNDYRKRRPLVRHSLPDATKR